MKIKSVVAAVALAAVSVSGFAANYTATFDSDGIAFIFQKYKNLSSGATFNDTWSFSGLTSGTYDVSGSISATSLSFSSIVMDGTPWKLSSNGLNEFSASVEYTGSAPASLNIAGTKIGSKIATYSGTVAVTAVPEPETYAMLLAGLGVMGAIARRRKQAA